MPPASCPRSRPGFFPSTNCAHNEGAPVFVDSYRGCAAERMWPHWNPLSALPSGRPPIIFAAGPPPCRARIGDGMAAHRRSRTRWRPEEKKMWIWGICHGARRVSYDTLVASTAPLDVETPRLRGDYKRMRLQGATDA